MNEKRNGITALILFVFVAGMTLFFWLVKPDEEKVMAGHSADQTSQISIQNDRSEDEGPIILNISDIKIHTVSKPVFCSPPEDCQIPEFYSSIEIPYLQDQVYCFISSDGVPAYRCYGRCYTMINNIREEELTGFWAVEIIKDKNGMPFVQSLSSGSPAVDSIEDVQCMKHTDKSMPIVPAGYIVLGDNLYGCFRNAPVQQYRTWGFNGKLYPCSASGIIPAGSVPVDFYREQLNLNETASAHEEYFLVDYRYPADLGNGFVCSVLGRK